MDKPLPVPTPTTQPFWDGLAEGQVRIQQCDDCNHWIFYPRHLCSNCLSSELSWKDITGEGTLYTFTVAWRPTAPMFADEVPQKLAVVELDEGPRLTSTLVNIEPEDIAVGMSVKPVFEAVDDADITMLRYEPT